MGLSNTAKAMLQACASAMVDGVEDPNLNLYYLIRERVNFRRGDEVIAELRAAVENKSGAQLTVRRAGENVRVGVKGPGITVVVCPIGVSEEVVNVLEEDMSAYFVGPYDRGCYKVIRR